jgi:hypothetical protein
LTIFSLVEKKATLPLFEIPSNRAGDACAAEAHQSAASVSATRRVFVTGEGIGAVSAGSSVTLKP